MNAYYETKNIILATTLYLEGYKLIGVEKVGKLNNFIFENVDDDILRKYELDDILVSPKSFNAIQRQLTVMGK